MINIKGEILNSKRELIQPKVVRTTIHTDGAELAVGSILSFLRLTARAPKGMSRPRLLVQGLEDQALLVINLHGSPKAELQQDGKLGAILPKNMCDFLA